MDATKLMELMKNKKQALKPKAKTLKPKPGQNRYVVLPGWRKGEEHLWFHDFGQHFVKNEAGEIQAVYVCADKTYGNPCPICEGLSKAIKMTSDDDTVKLLKEAVSGQTYLLNVLALDEEDDATPQILQLGKLAFGQLVEMIEQWGVAVFDAAEPIIVQVTRDGKGLNTKYTVQPSPKKHTLPKGVLSKLNNLDEYVKQENEEQQRRALSAINNVAGLLPSKDTPATSTGSFSDSKARDTGDDDLRDLEGSREKAANKPSAADIALDDELDDLLGDLIGTDA